MQIFFSKSLVILLILMQTIGMGKAQDAVRITHPAASSSSKVLHFRKLIGFQQKPEKFIVHLNSHSCYRFYVNGKIVAVSYICQSLTDKIYRFVDIAPFLKTGKNVLAALVWEDKRGKNVLPSGKNSFFLEGQTSAEEIVNTNNSWKVFENQGIKNDETGWIITGEKYLWNWEVPDYDDSSWTIAVSAGEKNKIDRSNLIFLPVLTEESQHNLSLVQPQNSGLAEFLQGNNLQIPADTTVSFLLTQPNECMACPVFLITNGRGATITLKVQSADSTWKKDVLMSDGEQRHVFQFGIHTFRQLHVSITTQKQPLIIHDYYTLIPVYFLQKTALFHSNDSTLNKNWNEGWKEVKHFIGDTYLTENDSLSLVLLSKIRYQALTFLYGTGEESLLKGYILQCHALLSERDFSIKNQPLLYEWIGMIHDLWDYGVASDFIKPMLSDAKRLLTDAHKITLANNFTTTESYQYSTEASANLKLFGMLQQLLALQQLIEVYQSYGLKNESSDCLQIQKFLQTTVFSQYWNNEKKYMADKTAKHIFSLKNQAMALLTGIVPEKDRQLVMQKILSDKSLIISGFDEGIYIQQALQKIDTGNYKSADFWIWLKENNSWERSTICMRAIYDIISGICGISSVNTASKTIKIRPTQEKNIFLQANFSHLSDIISVKYDISNSKLSAEIVLPKGMSGEFIYKGKHTFLKSGKNILNR
jgi:hypothetical protein